ncbi:MAG: ArsR/SmtB family transcription factor [Candidatus Obscuribacterales bacterium]
MKRLAEFFRVLSNPRRILIIEELKSAERDVSSIAAALELDQASVSKHLAVLRSYRLVVERKEGRSVFYRLSDVEMTSWIIDGLKFAGPDQEDTERFVQGIEQAKLAWNHTREED